ncbi:MAG: peptidoglycan-binding protein [Gemmatimonadota bacterium]
MSAGAARDAGAQEVEIISGGAPPVVTADAPGPGIRVIAFVQFDPDRTEHRVMSPLLPEEVLIVQEALAGAGYEPGPRNGILSPLTTAALSSFQDDARLEACGCVNYATLMALGLSGSVVQTVIGAPEDESDAEIVVGNNRLPASPRRNVVPAAVPPETVTVVQQVNQSWGWWSYPRIFASFPAGRPIGGAGMNGGVSGFPFGPVIHLGPSRPSTHVVPPRRP